MVHMLTGTYKVLTYCPFACWHIGQQQRSSTPVCYVVIRVFNSVSVANAQLYFIKLKPAGEVNLNSIQANWNATYFRSSTCSDAFHQFLPCRV